MSKNLGRGPLAAVGLGVVFCLALVPQTQPVKVDGQTEDWAPLTLAREARSGAGYAFKNDGRSLYVLFVVKDPKSRESLQSTGLTLLAGKARSRKLERGVLFLMRPVPAEAYIRWHESQGAFLGDDDKKKIRDAVQADLGLTFGVGAGGSVHGPLRRLDPDNEPPLFAVADGPEGLVYELKVPLAAPGAAPGGLGLSPGQTVRIAFEWGGASRKILGARANRETPPSEQGGLYGVSSPAQEFLNMFDSLSRPTMGTKRFSVAVDVRLAEAR